jgi:osmoprotectant transport system substrate-binding protein
MRRRRPQGVLTALILMAVLVGGACRGPAEVSEAPGALDDDSITVGSFDFVESVLLAEIYSQSLEHAGFTVERAFALGPREFVAPALAVGLIELVPEYVGSAATFVRRGEPAPTSDLATSYERLVTGLTGRRVAVLTPSSAQNANTFVVAKRTADAMDLRTLSDVAAVADDLIFGGPPECQRRRLCLVGLEEQYGITFGTVVSLRAGPLIEQALRDGGIDLGLMFTSDAAMLSADLVELRDDRDLQPAENITPLVREEVLERWGDRLHEAVDAVSARLTTEGLRRLNAEVDGDTTRVADVATAWLEAQDVT